ncbi:hypothetical protein E6H30_09360 [Candidatus Bathyarchaeota archaeon]|nr:MAG: hypothetical protein E6H30_09360 [Candidatus Bathyarchaeota archaeon]
MRMSRNLGTVNVRFRRRYLAVPIFLMVVAALLIVRFNAAGPSAPQRVASPPSPQCRKGNPLEGVSNPLRLRVISNCEVAGGIVKSVTIQDDGNWRIDVSLSPQYGKLLDVGNVNHQNGWLVLELISRDQPTISVPLVGKQIIFVGPLVYDSENYWNAIYPVWSIQDD